MTAEVTELIVALWQQAVWNGRVSTFIMACLVAILILKVVLYKITIALLREVRELVLETRTLTIEVRQLMTTTKAQASVAATAAERAGVTAARTAASAERVLGQLEQHAAADSGHALPAMPARVWQPGDPDRRHPGPSDGR